MELDPGNAIAVVGLARCALADGDDQEAHELASRALEIDPENDMARRMEARLSEILATRGADVARPAAAATPGPREMRAVVTDGDIEQPPRHPGGPGGGRPARARDKTDRPDHASRPTRNPRPSGPPGRSRRPPSQRSASVRKSLFDRLLGR